jgi:hypothetical protein
LDPGVTQIDAVATHWHTLCLQERALPPAHCHASIGSDHTMPGEVIVGGGQNEPDETRRTRIDVAVGADKPSWDRAHTADDVCRALGGQAIHIALVTQWC